MADIQFSAKQIELIRRPFQDNTLEVNEGTPRSGKTTGGAFRAARFYIETDDRDHLVLGYNQEQAFKLFFDCDGFGLQHIFGRNARVSHDDEYGYHLAVKTPKGLRRIFYKGAGKSDSHKAYQGLSFGSVVFLEIDLLHMNAIQEAFRRTYAARKRWHLADLNPPAPQHPVIKEVFDVQNTIWTHWTMADNPVLTEERKQEIFRLLSRNPYLLERDWYGNRCIPQGVIYSMFSHKENIVATLPVGWAPVEMYFAGDGGLNDATSIGCYLIIRNEREYKLCRMAGFYYSGQDTGIVKAMSVQAREIAQTFLPWCREKFGRRESRFFVDPACKALREELRLFGIETIGADNNAHDVQGSRKGIKVGIERLQSSMEQRRFLLVEATRFDHYGLLRELPMYVLDNSGEPVDMYNHACDEARYAHNYFYKNYVRV